MIRNPTLELLREIEAFLEQTGMPPSAFGRATIGDPNLVRDLKDGRELRFQTTQTIKNYIASYRRRKSA
jgi:hypothetical protein